MDDKKDQGDLERKQGSNPERQTSDDELLSKLLDSSLEDEEAQVKTKVEKRMASKKSVNLGEILRVVFALVFIVFIVLLVYMKYSNNCGLLGSSVESLVGGYLCPSEAQDATVSAQQQIQLPTPKEQAKTVEQTKEESIDDNQAGDEKINDETTSANQEAEKITDSNGVELIDDPFADTEKLQKSKSESTPEQVEQNNPLTDQQQKDLAATFDGQTAADGTPIQPPKPVYETPALLISENKQKITNRQPVRIKSIGYKDGQEFQKGDILVTFDCKQIEYDLDIQKEILKDKQASLENLQKLRKLKSTSEYSVVKAESEFGQTQKIIAKLEDQLSDCVIKAEYSGKVIATSATEGEFLFAGKEIMSVNNSEDLLVKAYVPVDWIDWLQIGTTFKLCIGTECYNGVVNRIGAEVDAISQTLDVFGRIPVEGNDKLIPGLSGQITFDKP